MSHLYLGGVPTEPDVKLLREAFKSLRDGAEVTHEEVERILRIKRGTSRYRTVTMAWRRWLFNQENTEVAAVSGVGFRYLEPEERVTSGVKTFRRGTKVQGRGLRRLAATPEESLDAPTKTKRDHVMRIGAAIHAEAHAMMKQLLPPKVTAQIADIRPKFSAGGKK